MMRPVFSAWTDWTWLFTSVCMDRTTVTSSTISARCGSSSDTSVPHSPCRANFHGEPNIFELAWAGSSYLIWPGNDCPSKLSCVAGMFGAGSLFCTTGSFRFECRWTIGGLVPASCGAAVDGAEPCVMQTQCLVEGDGESTLAVSVRFLHPLERRVGQLPHPLADWPADGEPEFRPVDAVQVGDHVFQAWQEAVERNVPSPDSRLQELVASTRRLGFTFRGTGKYAASTHRPIPRRLSSLTRSRWETGSQFSEITPQLTFSARQFGALDT